MKLKMILLAALIGLAHHLFAQAFLSDTTKGQWQIHLTPGVSAQSFAFKDRMAYPLSYLVQASLGGANASGFGLTLPFYITNKSTSIGLLVNPILRYDLGDPTINRRPTLSDENLIVDLHLSLYKTYQINFAKTKFPFSVGMGYSFISPFQYKDADFLIIKTPPQTPQFIILKRIKLDFEGYHLFFRFPVLKGIYFKQQLMYVPKGQIVYRGYWHTMMYHACIEIDPKLFSLKRRK